MSEEIELIRVPDFGIKGFVTFKERNNAAFRPSATHMIASMAYSNALSEGLEESDMNHYVPVEISGEINFENYKHIEFIGDTSWYNHRKKYVELINIDDSLDVALFPKDLVLFKATYCLEDKKELHWSNSGGYSHDTNKIIALNKGKSEIIEHHTKMFWWFGQSNIIERRVKSSVFEQLKSREL